MDSEEPHWGGAMEFNLMSSNEWGYTPKETLVHTVTYVDLVIWMKEKQFTFWQCFNDSFFF